MDKKYCVGCEDDFYNLGNNSTTGDCWQLETAKRIERKRVHISQRPPWKQEPELLPSCYRVKQYWFVATDKEN